MNVSYIQLQIFTKHAELLAEIIKYKTAERQQRSPQ